MANLTWTPEQIAEYERELELRPHFSRLNHISIPVRDLEVSKRFYIEVLGGRLIHNTEAFAEVLVAGTVVGLSSVRGRPQTSEAEFPHIGFEIESDQFLPMKRWLDEHGVRTHQPWTRSQIEGLMYFKDPSGNLIEIYCPRFAGAKEIRHSKKVAEFVDLRDLDYEWR
jgi:catechol 2,3-dioxygenase-like lactoylglutathione lyase family enzyme